MGYVGHNCDVNDLYPGNSYVDWIVWDPYLGSTKTLDQTGMGLFYTLLTSNTTSTRAYTSKPWGYNEWGAEVVGNKPGTYQAYNFVKAALDNGTYPNIKLYDVWDSHVANTDKNWQIGFAQLNSSVPPSLSADATEQSTYNAFANDPRLFDSFY
jgi:beta-mannanase